MEAELFDIKLSLDRETIEWLQAGAFLKNTSKSGFLRMIPTLLTPEERRLIDTVRKATVTTVAVGRDNVVTDP